MMKGNFFFIGLLLGILLWQIVAIRMESQENLERIHLHQHEIMEHLGLEVK